MNEFPFDFIIYQNCTIYNNWVLQQSNKFCRNKSINISYYDLDKFKYWSWNVGTNKSRPPMMYVEEEPMPQKAANKQKFHNIISISNYFHIRISIKWVCKFDFELRIVSHIE